MKKKNPDTKWLLLLVGLFMPEDPIFHKSYKWSRPKVVEDSDEYLSNDDDVYTNLTQLDDKVIRKTNRIAIPKEKKIKKQLKAIRARKERDAEREEELLALAAEEISDSDDDLELSELSDEQPREQVIQHVEHDAESDFNLADDSPVPKKKRVKKKSR